MKVSGMMESIFLHLTDLADVNSFSLFLEQQQRFPDNEQLQRPHNLEKFREEPVENISCLLAEHFTYKCKLSKVIPSLLVFKD